MKRLVGLVFALNCGMIGAFQAQAQAQAQVQSAFGCSDLSARGDLPVVEGKEGVFFRVNPDMRNFYSVSDETVELVGELSEALATTGTVLIFLPVPTKSLAMPGYLTYEAEDFGFDPDLATTVYLDVIKRLEKRGVATADPRRAMVQAQFSAPAYFKADHRWTAAGAGMAAVAVAERLGAVPDMVLPGKGGFTTSPGETITLESEMFAQIQQHCQMTIPAVSTASFATQRNHDTTRPTDNAPPQDGSIAVVGTEYTGEPATNFPGFLAEQTGADVVQYAVAGGGAFGAISSYLTSDAFQTARPDVLIWEVPVDENLAQFGDQPMRELIATAGNTCRVPLNLFTTGNPNQISVDLNKLDVGLKYTLFVDSGGAASPEATFTFRSRSGLSRSRTIVRNPDQIHTGRFGMPMSGLWADGASSVEIELTAPFGSTPRAMACFYSGKG